MGAGRASTVAVAAVVGAVLVMILMVTWAASIGPGGVLTGDGPATHRVSPTPTRSPTPSGSATATRSPQPRPEPGGQAGDNSVVRALLAVLATALGLAVVAGAVLLARRLWERWVDRDRPPPPPELVEFDVIETPRRVAEEIARDADRQRDLLLEGAPRNGIVRCWHRFETQAAAAGLVRRDWETSAEFTLRVLDLVDADSALVSRLAALYREARFSDHPLGEAERAEALTALDAIHARLAGRTGARP
jgi:hypothetical protein